MVQEFLRLPAILRVAPVLTGGRALLAHGLATQTEDIDFLIGCETSDLSRLATELRAAGYQLDTWSELAIRDGNAVELRCYRRGIQIDLIPTADTRLKEVYTRAIPVEWSAVKVGLLKLADVLVEKLRTGRLPNATPYLCATRLLTPLEKQLARADCDALGLTARYEPVVRTLFGG